VSYVRAPSITTTVDNDLILCFFGNLTNTYYTPPSGLTEPYDEPYLYDVETKSLSNMMSWFNQATHGATGDQDALPVSTPYSSWVGYTIAINAVGTLPIQLLNFNCNYDDKHVLIDWETASETNNDYFSIERSKDCKNWELIENIKGAGNSISKLNYNTIDYQPLSGVSYYRLKQTDYDGKFTYSMIVSVNANENIITRVYPNPNKGNFIIDIKTFNDDKVDIKVMNILGSCVYEENNVSLQNSYKTNVNLEGFNSGVYFVIIQSKESRTVKKLIIQK